MSSAVALADPKDPVRPPVRPRPDVSLWPPSCAGPRVSVRPAGDGPLLTGLALVQLPSAKPSAAPCRPAWAGAAAAAGAGGDSWSPMAGLI